MIEVLYNVKVSVCKNTNGPIKYFLRDVISSLAVSCSEEVVSDSVARDILALDKRRHKYINLSLIIRWRCAVDSQIWKTLRIIFIVYAVVILYHLALILFDLIKFSIKLFRQYYKTELANMVRESISRISLLESPYYGMNFKIK